MKTMFKNELVSAVAEQLALDYCCNAEDFACKSNKVTLAGIAEGRRVFRAEPDFFKAGTMGNATVITAAGEMLDFANELAEKYGGAEIFELTKIREINAQLAKYNKAIAFNSIFYLPVTPYSYTPNNKFELEFYEKPEIISELYPVKGFNNALMYDSTKPRHDVLAVCAFDNGQIIGMAGASNDSQRFWQIGIDVLPEYRGKGIATELVSALTKAVFEHGAIPYYGTWSGNIASQNTARKAGYYPVWTEMNAFDIE
ncbi:MAG: GNAT family N-acetyltransferase [Oscillospiraceae bacterium]|nr:GNAT family N-acetyltransferase [Oscillospiraceae bacterium]MBQ8780651.1 GNAT family N-acetyltransferase [Oscillospiraceae bacterium]